MLSFDELLEINPYSLDKMQKEHFLTESLKKLTQHHIQNCNEYKKMMHY